jgi:hypothetical protein
LQLPRGQALWRDIGHAVAEGFGTNEFKKSASAPHCQHYLGGKTPIAATLAASRYNDKV